METEIESRKLNFEAVTELGKRCEVILCRSL